MIWRAHSCTYKDRNWTEEQGILGSPISPIPGERGMYAWAGWDEVTWERFSHSVSEQTKEELLRAPQIVFPISVPHVPSFSVIWLLKYHYQSFSSWHNLQAAWVAFPETKRKKVLGQYTYCTWHLSWPTVTCFVLVEVHLSPLCDSQVLTNIMIMVSLWDQGKLVCPTLPSAISLLRFFCSDMLSSLFYPFLQEEFFNKSQAVSN